MKKTLLTAFFFFTNSCLASNWALISSPDNPEITVSVDLQSVGKSGAYRKAWVMYSLDKSEQTPDFKPYNMSKILQYFDCKQRAFATVHAAYYLRTADRQALSAGEWANQGAKTFVDVVPDSLGEMTLDYVCGLHK